MGVVGGRGGLMDARVAKAVREDRGLEVGAFLRVDLHGGPKVMSQYFSKARKVVSAFMSGRGTATPNIVKRSHHEDHAVVEGVAGRLVCPLPNSGVTENGILLAGTDGVLGSVRVPGGGLERAPGVAGCHEVSGVNLHGGPREEVFEALLEELIA